MNKFDAEIVSENIRVVCGVERRAASVDASDGGAGSDRWVVVRTMKEVFVANSLWQLRLMLLANGANLNGGKLVLIHCVQVEGFVSVGVR